MPVVFDPRVGASLLGHLVGAIAGQAIARKTSFLLDALGTAGVRARHHDRATIRTARTGCARARSTARGCRCRRPRSSSDGVLETWLLDSASARQLGLEPTGHAARGVGGAPGVSTSNLYMAAGDVPVATLIARHRATACYVTELIGQGVNGVTGDYSRGAAGFRIERRRRSPGRSRSSRSRAI